MEWSKLKSIILILLVVVDLLLMGLAMYLHAQTRHQRQNAEADLIALFAQSDIALPPSCLPAREPLLSPRTTVRDTDAEAQAAAALLGEITETNLSGSTHSFASDRGTAVFSANGNFSVTLEPGALPAAGSPARQAAKLLRSMGVEAVQADAAGEAEAAELVFTQTVEDLPIFSCTVTFGYDETSLISCSGRCLLGETPVRSGDTPLSTATLLLHFLNDVKTGGDLCSEITSLDYGYRFTGSYGSALTPVLRISTNIGDYFVSASAASVDRTGS
ncbi:MAG: hypothetical protein IKD96_00695 [Oscillospiraceae bacterium]|nr:hypothetical protein [Oscillospiraceae bacterium]